MSGKLLLNSWTAGSACAGPARTALLAATGSAGCPWEHRGQAVIEWCIEAASTATLAATGSTEGRHRKQVGLQAELCCPTAARVALQAGPCSLPLDRHGARGWSLLASCGLLPDRGSCRVKLLAVSSTLPRQLLSPEPGWVTLAALVMVPAVSIMSSTRTATLPLTSPMRFMTSDTLWADRRLSTIAKGASLSCTAGHIRAQTQHLHLDVQSTSSSCGGRLGSSLVATS